MALNDNIILNSLSSVRKIEDKFISALDSTMSKLNSGLMDAVISGSDIATAETALARQNVEKILLDSGYYETTGKLLDEGYQDTIEESFKIYKKSVSENFQFADASLERLNSIKNLDLAQFTNLGDNFATQITRTMTDLQFGAITKNQAIKLLAENVDMLKRHASTWVTTGLSGIYRESSMMLAEDNGLEQFIYVGPRDGLTRPFCSKYLNQTKTKKEWDALIEEQNQGLAPVSQFGGGYNCRHQFIGVA